MIVIDFYSKMQHFHFETLPSTNDFAKAHLSLFPKEGYSLITAEEQTAGRGRFSRTWYSPKGKNLYATFVKMTKVVQLEEEVQHLAKALQTLLFAHGLQATIKWPNDLLIGHKKVAGILIETVPYHEMTALIIGLGLNLNMTETEVAAIDQAATSLFIESGRLFDKTALLQELIPLLLAEDPDPPHP
jgi:BirA family biotin operon repressor/biotin-[acetyl-CoA-carboxylase] ligase